VPNPDPKPVQSFINVVHPHRGRCARPDAFPEKCTIFWKEGDTVDFSTERGVCCILAVLRDTEPKIFSNVRQITNFNANTLTLELVDPHQNTWLSTERDAFVKIDLLIRKC